MSFFRVQSFTRRVEDLLDPEHQLSHSFCTDTVRSGVSVMGSLEDLAGYIAITGIPFTPEWVLVELDGDRSTEEDEDAEHGAILIHPTEIISVSELDDEFFDLLDAAFDTAA